MAVAPSLFAISVGAYSFLVGRLSDRCGAEKVLISGVILSAIVFLSLPVYANSWWFALVYGFGGSVA